MEREFKFRAWDGDKMHYNVVPWQWDFVIDTMSHKCIEKSFGSGFLGSGGSTAKMEVPAIRFEKVMQFIGLKDKKEKKIYEGDILEIRIDSGRIERFKVEWGIHRREMKSGYTVDIPSFAFVSNDDTATFPIVNNYVSGHDLDIIEIIGNIHENPELWIP